MVAGCPIFATASSSLRWGQDQGINAQSQYSVACAPFSIVILAQPASRHSGAARISVLVFALALAVACPLPPTQTLRHPDRSAQREVEGPPHFALAVACLLPHHPPTPSSRPERTARSGGTPALRPCRCRFSSAPTNSAVILSGVAHGLIVSHAVEEPRHISPDHNRPNRSPNAPAPLLLPLPLPLPVLFVCHSAVHPGFPASGLCSLGWSSGICFCL